MFSKDGSFLRFKDELTCGFSKGVQRSVSRLGFRETLDSQENLKNLAKSLNSHES